MKKLIMLFTAFVLSLTMFLSAEAKTVQVTTLEDFSPNNPPQVLHIQMNGNVRLDYDNMLFQGFHVTGRVVPGNGGLVFVPVSYINYHEENLNLPKQFPALIKTRSSIVRQNQPFTLVFPNENSDTFKYYVPSNSDMN